MTGRHRVVVEVNIMQKSKSGPRFEKADFVLPQLPTT